MVQVWQLALIAHEVRMLYKEGVVIDVSGISGGSVLMQEEAFDKMFPVGWTERNAGTAVLRSFNYDGIEFLAVMHPKEKEAADGLGST